MDALAVKLDLKLREWKTETAEEVRALVNEIVGLADDDALDLMRSRAVEQERALAFAMDLQPPD